MDSVDVEKCDFFLGDDLYVHESCDFCVYVSARKRLTIFLLKDIL